PPPENQPGSRLERSRTVHRTPPMRTRHAHLACRCVRPPTSTPRGRAVPPRGPPSAHAAGSSPPGLPVPPGPRGQLRGAGTLEQLAGDGEVRGAGAVGRAVSGECAGAAGRLASVAHPPAMEDHPV